MPRGVGHATSIYAKRAKNAEIWSEDGKRYIDFAAGIAVVNTGHQHPKIVAAIEEQLKAFSHVCFQVTPYENYVRLAERLNALAPVESPAKTMLISTGAEAVENAVKVARAFTGRPGIVSFSGGFHGRTLMGMALTGKVVPYKKGYGPFPADERDDPRPAGKSARDLDRVLDGFGSGRDQCLPGSRPGQARSAARRGARSFSYGVTWKQT